MREVSENLKSKELTLEDFTFFKEPLGIDDPEKEIIRDAKLKTAGSTPLGKRVATPKEKKKVDAVASPRTTSDASETDTPKGKATPKLGGFKVSMQYILIISINYYTIYNPLNPKNVNNIT